MRIYPQLFSQRDPSYSSTLINSVAGATIGLYGCLITSWAMKADYYGESVNPIQLMELLAQHKLFVNGDYISNDNDLSIVFPSIKYVRTENYQSIPADLDSLKLLSDDDTITVTLELDFDHNPTDRIQTHFVELNSCVKNVDGSFTIQIYDPWDGYNKLFSETYGNDPKTTILKYIVYQGTPQPESATPQDTNTMSIDQDLYKRLVAGSTNSDQIGSYFGFSSDQMKDPTAGDQIVSKIKDLKTQIITLQTQLQNIPHEEPPAPPASTNPEPVVSMSGTSVQPASAPQVEVKVTTSTPIASPSDPLKLSNSAENQAISNAITMSKENVSAWQKILSILRPFRLIFPFD